MSSAVTPLPQSGPSLRERVAAELRATMARQRVSQATLARALQVSPMWVSRRYNGDAALDMDDLDRIARVLGVAVEELFPASDMPSRTSDKARFKNACHTAYDANSTSGSVVWAGQTDSRTAHWFSRDELDNGKRPNVATARAEHQRFGRGIARSPRSSHGEPVTGSGDRVTEGRSA